MRSCLLFVAFLASSADAAAREPVTYRIRYSGAVGRTLHVSLDIPEGPRGRLALVMPRAVPMGYGEQAYDRFVEGLGAFNEAGQPLPVEREPMGPRWQVGSGSERVARIEYEIDLARMEREIASAADASRAREGYVLLLGYSVLAFLDVFEDEPVRLEVQAPDDWPVLSTLAPEAPPATGTLAAEAPDFYALADSQIALGPDLDVRRLDAPLPLYLAIHAEAPVDAAILARLATEAMEAVLAYFGGASFDRYTVLLEFLRPVSERHRYGFSMEHLSSGTFTMSVDDAVTDTSPETHRARHRFNLAHHMAHAWIPKRCHGEGYYPHSWELAPIIDTIWLSEGFIRYVVLDALADRMPPAEAEAYRRATLAELRQIVAESPAFLNRMSLRHLSQVASTRYSEDFRTGRNLFARGALLAAEIDETIQRKTRGAHRFRDGIRQLLRWGERAGRAFRVEEIPAIFSEATGVDIRAILSSWQRPLADSEASR